jgi:KaiC/GvpD/RAD55 family RecA-like ATPase
LSAIAEKYGIDLTHDHKVGCPGCIRKGNDNSRNNLQVYGETESAHCFACGWTIASKEHREAMGWDEEEEYDEEEELVTKEKLTDKEIEQFKGYTSESGGGVRGISDATYKHYAVRTKYDQSSGEADTQYYPYFEDGSLAGLKLRKLPKTFSSIGRVSSNSELFGYFRYKKSTARTICIFSGEIDAMSGRDMLVEYAKNKGTDFEETPCVSPATGEGSSTKQLKAHYEWFDRADKIIYFADQDDAGQAAIEKVVKALPHDKVYIATLPAKDVNELLMKGRQKDFINAFFKAKKFVPKGIVGSGDIYDKIVQEAMTPRLEFPPFMSPLNDLTGGGQALGTCTAISASTGVAKSTICNEMVYYWLFNSPHKIGVVSMEQNAGQYGELMLSRHTGRKIGRMKPEEKLEFLRSDWCKEKSQELFFTADGDHRWHVLDERDESTEGLQEKILELIIACGCKVVCVDTLSDIFDSMDVPEQQKFTKWIKSVINKYGVLILLICHLRKAASGQKDGSKGAMADESSVQGSSTIVKSVALNIMLARNKLSDDPIERNTTIVALTKNRSGSETSNEVCKIYYDSATHTLHDLEKWLEDNPHQF